MKPWMVSTVGADWSQATEWAAKSAYSPVRYQASSGSITAAAGLGVGREVGSRLQSRLRRGPQLLAAEGRHRLLRGESVVEAAVDPVEAQVAADLFQRLRIGGPRTGDDPFEQPAHGEAILVL